MDTLTTFVQFIEKLIINLLNRTDHMFQFFGWNATIVIMVIFVNNNSLWCSFCATRASWRESIFCVICPSKNCGVVADALWKIVAPRIIWNSQAFTGKKKPLFCQFGYHQLRSCLLIPQWFNKNHRSNRLNTSPAAIQPTDWKPTFHRWISGIQYK